MSINEAQGQSVTVVVLNLQIPVFTHGQLYVALSCCTTKQGVKILFPEGMFNFSRGCILTYLFPLIDSEGCMTKNIVYPEVLL